MPRYREPRNSGALIFSPPLLSPDAVGPWTCAWPPPVRQPAEMLHRRHSILKLSHYRNELGELRQQNTHYRPLVWTADGRPHPAVTRTLQCAADIASSRNGQHLSATSLHRRFSCTGGQPWLAQFSRIFQRGQSGTSQASSTELCTTGATSLLSTVCPATTTSTALRLTQQYQTTAMKMSLQGATRLFLCSYQVSNCPVYPCARREGVRLSANDGALTQRAGPTASQVSTALQQSPPREQFRGQRGLRATTFWRSRTTSFRGVFQRSRTPQRFRGPTEASALTSCVTSTLLPTWRPTDCWT